MIRSLSLIFFAALAGVTAAAAQPVGVREGPRVADVAAPTADAETLAVDARKDPPAAEEPADSDQKTPEKGDAGPEDSGKTASAAAQAKERDDAVLDRAQPDFTLVNLQTSLRLPKYKSAFRVTHRFTRSLGQGDFGDLLSDFFGFDAGALIGLEYRFGLMSGLQAGILRTSDKTIQFFSQYEVKAQSASFPIGIAALAMIDGTNNFRDSYSPAIGVILSRSVGTRLAMYVQPIWVNNSNDEPSEIVDHNDTMLLGMGARVRISGGTYVVGEFIPRVAGYDPGAHGGSFAIEKRAGGHAFQVNFSNTFGTTIGQIARGGVSSEDWFIGFNISRKFF